MISSCPARSLYINSRGVTQTSLIISFPLIAKNTLAMSSYNAYGDGFVTFDPKNMPFRRLGPSGLRVPLFSIGSCVSYLGTSYRTKADVAFLTYRAHHR